MYHFTIAPHSICIWLLRGQTCEAWGPSKKEKESNGLSAMGERWVE
jgi:hypothetical protein